MAWWWNWQTHHLEGVASIGRAGSSPAQVTNKRPRGGIGRHARFRIWCESVAGSNPAGGTNTENMETNIKDVVKGTTAKFSHAIAGNLYYVIDGRWQFVVDMNDREDVGTATFPAECKAITLMRYVRKSMESGTFTEVA